MDELLLKNWMITGNWQQKGGIGGKRWNIASFDDVQGVFFRATKGSWMPFWNQNLLRDFIISWKRTEKYLLYFHVMKKDQSKKVSRAHQIISERYILWDIWGTMNEKWYGKLIFLSPLPTKKSWEPFPTHKNFSIGEQHNFGTKHSQGGGKSGLKEGELVPVNSFPHNSSLIQSNLKSVW